MLTMQMRGTKHAASTVYPSSIRPAATPAGTLVTYPMREACRSLERRAWQWDSEQALAPEEKRDDLPRPQKEPRRSGSPDETLDAAWHWHSRLPCRAVMVECIHIYQRVFRLEVPSRLQQPSHP